MALRGLMDGRLGIERLGGGDPGSVFEEIAKAFVAGSGLAAAQVAEIRQAFLDRERRGSTAFGFGVAIPHVFHPAIVRTRILVARHPTGIDLGAIDGQLTQILICLAGPETEREAYLAALRQIAQTMRNRDWRRFILAAPDTAAIYEVLLEAAPG